VRRAATLLVVLVPVLAAGCGGGPKSYSVTKTRACLVKKGAKLNRKLDFVASTATGGAFRAVLRDNFVTVAFGETEGDAKQIELAYHRFAFPNVRKGLADVLKRDRNAVMLWHQHPQDANLSLVQACLK
jgi:hypothetical protein